MYVEGWSIPSYCSPLAYACAVAWPHQHLESATTMHAQLVSTVTLAVAQLTMSINPVARLVDARRSRRNLICCVGGEP